MNNKHKCSCSICKLEITTANLLWHNHNIHQYVFPKPPRIYGHCKHCGKQIRGYYKKEFCNKSCAATYNNLRKPHRSEESKLKTSLSVKGKPSTKAKFTPVKQCKICLKWFKRNPGSDPKTCSEICAKERQREYGRKSATVQKRRSKDEIELYDLCCTKFSNVRHNEQIADGWDADIILDDFKVAILWNGPWHYKNMGIMGVSLKQVKNRDKLKQKALTQNGWNVMIFEDRRFTPADAFKEIIETLA